MSIKEEYHSKEAEEVMGNSEFIKRTRDFAKFMQAEYITADSGHSMIICAIDKTFGDGKIGAAHILMGNRKDLAEGLASMSVDPETSGVLHAAQIIAGNNTYDEGDVKRLRSNIRTGYWLSVLVSFWALVIVMLQVFGITDWMSTITNLLLTGFIGYQLFISIRDMRKKMRRIEKICQRERNERMERHLNNLFHDMMKRFEGPVSEDDDEDE